LTLVDLWNTDCIPCVQAMTELMKVQRTYGQRGLVVVGIAVNERGRGEDNAAKIRWRTGQKGVDYPLFMEQPGRSAAQVFKVEQVPTLVLLDEQGREIWRNVGFNPDTRRALDQVLSSRLR
jgi:thiol-disulfide isomerase/thioredoxin